MEICYRGDAFKKKDTAVALGTFDGMHLGHKSIIGKMVREAKGLRTAVYTFLNIPAAFFGEGTEALFTKGEKIRAFADMGVDLLILEDFDQKMAAIPPERFVDRLTRSLGAKKIYAGFNYTFGAEAKGTSRVLENLAAERGAEVLIADPVMYRGEPVSSTRIRGALLGGDMEKAEAMLGAAYSISGVVEGGKRLGRTIGFPTVNFYPPKQKLCPMHGVYASYAVFEGKTYMGITNIGRRPTIDDGDAVNLETHIIDFNRDIYGKPVEIQLKHWLRGEVKFANVSELQHQLSKDKRKAMQLLGKRK